MSGAFTSVVDYNTNKYDNLIIGAKTNDLGGIVPTMFPKLWAERGERGVPRKPVKRRSQRKPVKRTVPKPKNADFTFLIK